MRTRQMLDTKAEWLKDHKDMKHWTTNYEKSLAVKK